MKLRWTIWMAAFALVASTTAAAAATTATDPAAAQVNPDKKTCRIRSIKASRFVKKVCMTAAEWAQWEKDSEQNRDYLQQQKDRHTFRDSN